MLEFFGILLLLAWLGVTFVLPIVALVRANAVGAELEELKRQVRELRAALFAGAPSTTIAPDAHPQSHPPPVAQPTSPPPVGPSPFASPPHTVAPPPSPHPPQPVPPTPAPTPQPHAPPPPLPAKPATAYHANQSSTRVLPIPTGPSEPANAPTVGPPRPIPQRQPPQQRQTAAQWEITVGGNWLNRIGAVALLIAFAFFLAYAYQQQWITPWMLICTGFASGTALIQGGSHFNKREMEVFAQGLIGAGISILYISAYASFNVYQLVSQSVALLMMATVTLTAILQSLKYDAIAVSLLALIGGFLTPALLTTKGTGGDANAFGLFAYISLLDIGLLAVTFKKDSWAVIEPLALLATYATYLIWHKGYYSPEMLGTSVYFLTVFWALFHVIDLCRNATSVETFSELRSTVAVLNVTCYCIAIYLLMHTQSPHQFAATTAGLSVLYIATGSILATRARNNPIFTARSVVTAAALLAIAITIQFAPFQAAALWAVEGLFIVMVGSRLRATYAWTAGFMLLTFTLVKLLLTPGAFGNLHLETYQTVFNLRFMAFAVTSLAFAASAVALKRLKNDDADLYSMVLHYVWTALMFTSFTVEINDHFRALMAMRTGQTALITYSYTKPMIMSAVWTIYSLPLSIYGLRKRLTPLTYTAIASVAVAVFFVATCGAEFKPISSFVVIGNLRFTVFALVLIGLAAHWKWLLPYRQEHKWIPGVIEILQFTLVWLGFELVTVETADYFRKSVGPTLLSGGMGAMDPAVVRALTLSVIWTSYSVLAVWLGSRWKRPIFLWNGLVVLTLGVLTAMFACLRFEPVASFTPIANLRVLAFLAVIAGLICTKWYLSKYHEAEPYCPAMMHVLRVAISLMALELLTLEINDSFRRRLAAQTSPAEAAAVNYAWPLVIAAAWTVYSVIVVWFAGIRRFGPVAIIGAIAVAMAILFTSLCGGTVAFAPIERFVFLGNLRAGVFAVVLLGIAAHWMCLRRYWEDLDCLDAVRGICQLLATWLGFELLTVEVLDYCQKAAIAPPAWLAGISLGMARTLMLAAVWAAYSLLVVWYGYQKKSSLLPCSAFAILVTAVTAALIGGIGYEPISAFTVIANLRALAVALVIVAMLFHQRWLGERRDEFEWAPGMLHVFHIAIGLSIFELLTVETWDHFARSIHSLAQTGEALQGHRMPWAYAQNLRQSALSVVWVVYSILLMGYGIWRRMRTLRLVAIGLFYFTIFKVFLYDLSSLETLYRIFSLMGLGLILLATSYLYQRFKAVILD